MNARKVRCKLTVVQTGLAFLHFHFLAIDVNKMRLTLETSVDLFMIDIIRRSIQSASSSQASNPPHRPTFQGSQGEGFWADR